MKQQRHGTNRPARFAVLAVTVVAGMLFGISVKFSHQNPAVTDTDLQKLVESRQDEVKALEANNAQMRNEIEALLQGEVAIASPLGATDLTGPGIRVELSDAPSEYQPADNIDPGDLVVHQGDIDAVLNALWAGGAEAVSVQGVRIDATTPVRCIGNVILIGSSSFAPPYRIEAIGEPDTLLRGLGSDPQVKIYTEYSAVYGLGWDVTTAERLVMPALPEGNTLQYAQKMGES